MGKKRALFFFHGDLNDFLPPGKRRRQVSYEFNGNSSMKNAIESIGVPHAEVDVILANGVSVGFSAPLTEGDRVSVFPALQTVDGEGVLHLVEEPGEPRFILDVHLGVLSRKLRMLGFDTLYAKDWSDAEILRKALAEGRTVLTRDIGLLKLKELRRGCWVRGQNPDKQLLEVLGRFRLTGKIRPFHRCISCNGTIREVGRETVVGELDPAVAEYHDEFFRCDACGKIYWKGTHYEKMRAFVEKLSTEKESA